MRLLGKLAQVYLFRVRPGSEAGLVEELKSTSRLGDSWSFYAWFGRFDLLAATETNEIFGRDRFLFDPKRL